VKSFFSRIHLGKFYQSHRRKPKKAKFVPPTRGGSSPKKAYSPTYHGKSTGSGKEKRTPRKILAKHHLSYSTLIFSLMVSSESVAPLNTT
jgi:hypothetical protein